MIKFLILFAVLILEFGAFHAFAQKKAKPKEVLIIEFLAPNHKEIERGEIFINNSPKADLESGGGSVSHCGHCTQEQIATQPSDYLYKARAFRMGKDKANVGFEVEVNEECKTRKIFTVYRNQRTKVQLNCGVSLTAYYGFESEEGN